MASSAELHDDAKGFVKLLRCANLACAICDRSAADVVVGFLSDNFSICFGGACLVEAPSDFASILSLDAGLAGAVVLFTWLNDDDGLVVFAADARSEVCVGGGFRCTTAAEAGRTSDLAAVVLIREGIAGLAEIIEVFGNAELMLLRAKAGRAGVEVCDAGTGLLYNPD